MTFREWAVEYCYKRGMFRNQATEVVESMIAGPSNGAMEHRWGDRIEDYPPLMQEVLAIELNSCAVRWMDANLPRAWYRGMFVPPAAGEGDEI